MEEAEELSHRVGIIDHGQLQAVGTQSELSEMVGETDTIKLELNRPDNEPLRQKLRELAGVSHVNGLGEQLILQTPEANHTLPSVLSEINAHERTVRQMQIDEPNLEAVFLHLTGRALRD
jgi:ABC-2 type transport system ATP-binding protein